MITETNKKEIEELEKEIEKRKEYLETEIKNSKIKRFPINTLEDIDIILNKLISEYKATIKTSIQWCEDEIEDIKWLKLTSNEERIKNFASKKYQQLTEHLIWLKEQEKEL
jgi:hypothetical protein